MKRRLWKFAFLLLVPLALYAYIAERNSWRPKTMIVSGDFTGESLEFSPTGRFLSSQGNPNNTVCVFDVVARAEVFRIENKIMAFFLSDQRLCVIEFIDRNSDVRQVIYSVPDGKRLVEGKSGYSLVSALPDERTVLLVKNSAGPQIFAWDTLADTPPRPYMLIPQTPSRKEAESTVLLLGGKLVIEGERKNEGKSNSFHIECWSIQDKVRHSTIQTQPVAFYTKGDLLISCDGFNATVWNWKNSRHVNSFFVGMPEDPLTGIVTDPVYALELSPDGSCMAAYNSTQIALWEVKTGRMVRHWTMPNREQLFNLAFSPDGRTLASVGSNGPVRLWRIK